MPRPIAPEGNARDVRPLDMRGSGAKATEQPNAAAERAPDRAPKPVTTPSPARPAVGSEGKAAIYGFAVKGAPPQRKQAPKKPKKSAPARRVNGSAPYAAALLGLRGKRSELAMELEKVDGAIKAIEALAA
jgi:hypothetical protein